MPDDYVLALFDAMLGELTGGRAKDLYDPAASGSLAEAILTYLPPGSPVPAYLRRMLLAGGGAGAELFGRLLRQSAGMLAGLVSAGLAVPGQDPAVRAAFLLCNDLAVLLLREHIGAAVGTDPLSGEGIARWAREMLVIYRSGLLASPSGDPP